MSYFPNSKAYPWALTGIFAAIHLVITLIPYSLAFGGGEISFGMVSAPLVGFLLGPFFGVVAVIIGSIIAIFINTGIAVIGPFTILATAGGAFAAGMIRSKKAYAVPILFVVSMAAYLISPVGVLVPGYIWFHVIAFFLSLMFVIPRVSKYLSEGLEVTSSNTAIFISSIWLLSIVSVTLDQAIGAGLGSYYFVVALGFDANAIAGFFEVSILLYAIERIIGSIILAILLAALAQVLSRSNLGLPITNVNPLQYEELPKEANEPVAVNQ